MGIRLEQKDNKWMIVRGYLFWKVFWCEEKKGWIDRDHIWYEKCKMTEEKAKKIFSYLELDY
jgi:hypothetical protein